MTIWILTEEYNAYDQYGEYFIHAWDHKPTQDELKKYIKETSRSVEKDYIVYVLNGGGRIVAGSHYDEHWYILKEIT